MNTRYKDLNIIILFPHQLTDEVNDEEILGETGIFNSVKKLVVGDEANAN